MSIRVRLYSLDDFDQLLTVQREAFPPPFPEELLWNREQIAAHVATYPEGAMLAEYDGDDIPEEYHRLARRLYRHENILSLIFVIIISLMILKPF